MASAGFQPARQVFKPAQFVLNPSRDKPARVGFERLRKHQLKGLILAQNERWRRGLGMQVERFM